MNNDNVSDLILKQQHETMQAVTNDAYDALVRPVGHGRISEEAFVYHFLPYFSGNYSAPVLQGRNVMAEWIGIAGAATLEVDVIDTAGNILYSVPPLFNTDTIGLQQAGNGNRSIKSMMIEYLQVRESAPRLAANQINKELANKYAGIQPDHTAGQNATQRWIAIMARYGITLDQTTAGQGQAPKGTDNNDDVVYD